MKASDEAGDVRQGEELPGQVVDAYLKTLQPNLQGQPVIKQFPGGASNLTYQVSYPERDFILRRPPLGRKAKGAHDMKRESELMRALRPAYPYVPEVLGYTQLDGVGDCYVMERMVGIIPRKDMPKGIQLTAEQTRQLCLNVIDRLIDLHQVDISQAGLSGLGKGEGYIARQINGWSERFEQAHTDDVGEFGSVMHWLKDKMPVKDNAICLIHNDYRFDNVVLDSHNPFKVVGVLDWEMATLGDPLMDLGNSLAYWVQADDEPMMQMMRRQPTHLPGMLTRAEVRDYYAAKTGWQAANFDFYTVYGLFRLAVIVQQIYYRFAHGQTTNPAFASFGQVANYLEQRCMRLVDASTL